MATRKSNLHERNQCVIMMLFLLYTTSNRIVHKQTSAMYALSALLYILLANLTFANDCECGEHCKKFSGYINADMNKCFFIANVNQMDNTGLKVNDLATENIIINNLLGGAVSSPTLSIINESNYSFKRLRQTCVSINCTQSVYVSTCKCSTNESIFKTVWNKVTFFFKNYNDIFWCIIGLLAVVVCIIIAKCVIC